MKVIGYLIIIFGLAISCEKGEIQDGCRNSKGKGEKEIIIGENNGMLVQFFEQHLIGSRTEEQSMEIDLDNDCTPDLRIISRVWGSAGLGSHGEAEIICLSNDVSILKGTIDDTSYYSFDSVFYEDSQNISITTVRNYLCSEKTDSIYEIRNNVDIVIPLENGDLLKSEENFNSLPIILSNDNIGYISDWGYIQDTGYYNHVFIEKDCHDFHSSIVNYIGVKITGKRKRKLGWIKMILFNGYEVVVLESAIEE